MRLPLQIISILSIALLLYSCSGVSRVFQRKERVYQPPRLGAEYRFENGLRRQKNPQDLFSKKDRKGMEKIGMRYSDHDRAAPNSRITPMQADSIMTGKTRDTTRVVSQDSTQVIPADTTLPQPVDTTGT